VREGVVLASWPRGGLPVCIVDERAGSEAAVGKHVATIYAALELSPARVAAYVASRVSLG